MAHPIKALRSTPKAVIKLTVKDYFATHLLKKDYFATTLLQNGLFCYTFKNINKSIVKLNIKIKKYSKIVKVSL